jgi:SAM-dependent methyltransferase
LPNPTAWPFTPEEDPFLEKSFELLRKKWVEVPAGKLDRAFSSGLLEMPDADLLAYWRRCFDESSTGPGYFVRGWYQELYRDAFRGKRIIDFGCGLGFDNIYFSQHGARVTFVDLVESNVECVRRLCALKRLNEASFLYMRDLRSLDSLHGPYDFVFCCGSLINAPLWVIQKEAQAILKHLPQGGRWIELAYPKERWVREGERPFTEWGQSTDGGAPWMEWRDLEKVKQYLAPARFDSVLTLNFHNDDFNWFDLVRRA